MSLFDELKRRNVFRVAIAYLVIAWLVMQVADLVLDNIGAPAWVMKTLFFLLALGFIISLVVSWAYELTEDGIKKEREVDRSKSITNQTARKLDYITLGALLMVGGMVFWQQFIAVSVDSRQSTAKEMVVEKNSENVEDAEILKSGLVRVPVTSKSIAVLPFVNMSDDKKQDYFSDGISEEILHVLTRIPELKVAGRTSSFKFKNINEDLRLIGEQLSVAHILEGSVRKQDNQVRVTAQLIRVSDGFHLWSQTFDRELTDVFAIQEEISQAVAKALTLTLNIGTSKSTNKSISPQAYDLYLRARQLLAMRSGEELEQAIHLFETVNILAPEFDEAYSGLGRALSLLWHYVEDIESTIFIDNALIASQKALAINNENAEAHSVLSILYVNYLWEWEKAQSELSLAIKYGGNDAEVANFAGDVYRILGDLEQAHYWEQRAIELDPLHAVNYGDMGWNYLAMQNCEKALPFFKKAQSMDSKLVVSVSGLTRTNICLGNWQESKKGIQHLLDMDKTVAANLERLNLAYHQNDRAAVESFKSLLIKEAKSNLYRHYSLAAMYNLLGDYENSGKALQQAYKERDPNFGVDDWYFLPEEWPDKPSIQAVFEYPKLKEFYQIRREQLKKSGYRQQKGI